MNFYDIKNRKEEKMTEVVRTKSGINIIFDELSNISTCSVGVFVKTGSKDEADNEEGISHVLEHMISWIKYQCSYNKRTDSLFHQCVK